MVSCVTFAENVRVEKAVNVTLLFDLSTDVVAFLVHHRATNGAKIYPKYSHYVANIVCVSSLVQRHARHHIYLAVPSPELPK